MGHFKEIYKAITPFNWFWAWVVGLASFPVGYPDIQEFFSGVELPDMNVAIYYFIVGFFIIGVLLLKLIQIQVPKIEITFENKPPYFQDEPIPIPGGTAACRIYRIRVTSNPRVFIEGVEAKVSEVRIDGKDELKGSARNLNLTGDKVLIDKTGKPSKEYQKEFSLKGDKKGQMVNVVSVPLAGDPNPYIKLMDTVSLCQGQLGYREMEIDILIIGDNCPNITKTFEIYDTSNENLRFRFREKQ